MRPKLAILFCAAIAVVYFFKHPRMADNAPLPIRYAGRYFHSLAWVLFGFGLLLRSKIVMFLAVGVYIVFVIALRYRVKDPSA
jgi:hypothetical protein